MVMSIYDLLCYCDDEDHDDYDDGDEGDDDGDDDI